MIEINLLPEELRRKKRKRAVEMPAIPVIPAVIVVAAVLIIAHLLLTLLVINNAGLSRTLEIKWIQMRPQSEKTEKVAIEIADLEKRSAAARKIAKPDLEWTRLLSGLNQAVIPNIWLSSFELRTSHDEDMPEALDITGYALGRSEEATSRVAKFINSMKQSEDFSGYFDEIELQNMRNHEIAGEEVMMFRLGCRFSRFNVIGAAVVESKEAGK